MTTQYTHISAKYPRACIKIDYILGHKISLNKYKGLTLLDHNGNKLQVNSKRKVLKFPSIWQLNHILLDNHV